MLSMLRITTSTAPHGHGSLSPGISVRPPQSMTLAVASLIGLAETVLDHVAFDHQFRATRNSPASDRAFRNFEMVDIMT